VENTFQKTFFLRYKTLDTAAPRHNQGSLNLIPPQLDLLVLDFSRPGIFPLFFSISLS